MGCVARLGCLILLVILGFGAWLTRDLWLPDRYRTHVVASAKPSPWEPLNAAGAERTQEALSKLNQPSGQVFQTLSASDVASYVFKALAKTLPASADSIESMVTGESVSMRALVRLSDLGGAGALGPLAGMLSDRERVQLTGTLRVVRPGLAEFTVQDLKVRNLSVPRGMIPALIKRLQRGSRPAGIAENALPLPIPRYVGDIRVANGKVTLYKTTQ